MNNKIKYIAISLLSLFYFQIQSHAEIKISPVILEINAGNNIKTTTLTIQSNHDNIEHNYEVKVFKWTQNEKGEDILEPNNELLVNPKSINLPVGAKKSIRIGFKQSIETMNLNKEESWRILFNEIPSSNHNAMAMNMTISFSVPLFVNNKVKKQDTNLEIRLLKQNSTPTLQVQNRNDMHVKIMNIEIQDSTGKSLKKLNGMKYILANQNFFYKVENLNQTKNLKAVVSVDQVDKPYVFNIVE